MALIYLKNFIVCDKMKNSRENSREKFSIDYFVFDKNSRK